MACGRSPPQASHRWRPGGFDRFPGLLCVGVGLELRTERRSSARPRQSPTKWLPELLPLTAADCASSTSETTSEKPKKIQNPPPGHRRSNRAYPQNYAVFNPRSHVQPGQAPVADSPLQKANFESVMQLIAPRYLEFYSSCSLSLSDLSELRIA